MSQNVKDLIQGAAADGLLPQGSVQALTVRNIGAEIQAGLGIKADDFPASEVVLVTVMPDDSGSIRFGNNAQAVRDGHNQVVAALKASKQAASILMLNRYLNGLILYPYSPLDQVVEMTSQNYDPRGGTPLYDQTVLLLGTVAAKTQEFQLSGVPVRSVTLIITDGEDAGSRRATPAMIKPIVTRMFQTENHIVAGMGIDDGSTDFAEVFREMGIPDQWILTPGKTPSEIRRAFQLFSQSAVRASQNAAAFSQAAMGGFGG